MAKLSESGGSGVTVARVSRATRVEEGGGKVYLWKEISEKEQGIIVGREQG